LRGRIEIWNLSSASKVPSEITTIQVDDVTYFEWSPDGEHILTATTAPRLRVSNGYFISNCFFSNKSSAQLVINPYFLSFKVWNYLGENKFSYIMPANNELWQVQWQSGSYPVKPIAKKTTVVKEESNNICL
jgi:translation initiation factor 2A